MYTSKLGGNPVGTFMGLVSVDPNTNKRSYALAYYEQAKSRPNLTVLVAATVHKIILEGMHFLNRSYLLSVSLPTPTLDH